MCRFVHQHGVEIRDSLHGLAYLFSGCVSKLKNLNIEYKQNISNGVREWAYSIANLRAWPMEDNRSDQDEAPVSKLNDTTKLTESFINANELNGFQKGYHDITNSNNAIAFVDSTKKRLLRIYSEWYNTLDIGFLRT